MLKNFKPSHIFRMLELAYFKFYFRPKIVVNVNTDITVEDVGRGHMDIQVII